MKMIHTSVPGHPKATLDGYILDCAITLGQEIARPAIVVCPGGGYLYCSPREAEPNALRYADWFTNCDGQCFQCQSQAM